VKIKKANPFEYNEVAEFVACVGVNGGYGDPVIRDGYRDAVYAIMKEVSENSLEDQYVYPIVYCARHSIELPILPCRRRHFRSSSVVKGKRMGRMRLELQFKRAAEMRFREHMDKHALKREGKLKDAALIFGYSTLYNLLDFSDNFCNWLQEHNLSYMYICDIPVKAWNEFLEEKSAAKVSMNTLKNYKSRINTWEKIINAAFKTDIKWSKGLEIPYRLTPEEEEIKRIQQMRREDFEMLMEYIRKTGSKSKAVAALELSTMFGLRAEGTSRMKVRNVHLDKKGLWDLGTIDITEKGNRHRIIDIKSENDRKVIEKMIEGKSPDDRLVPIKKDSVNKFLNRIMKTTGIKEKYPETSIHSFRKMYAQETWDNCREKDHSLDEALRYVNRQLGHGEERNKPLLAVYVKNMW